MKNMMKLAVISALVALGIVQSNAQNTNINLVANISLTGFRQNGDSNAAPVRIANKDILADLGNSSGTSFARGAQLLIVSQNDNSPGFVVREKSGTTVTDTALSSDNLSVSSGTSVVGKNVEYAILTFHFDDGAGNSFTVSGFGTLRHGRITGHGIGVLSDKVVGAAVQVSGDGTVNGDTAVFRGVISAGGPKAELAD